MTEKRAAEFVRSIYPTGPVAARVDLDDGIGVFPDLRGRYPMVILGRWRPGTVGFDVAVHLT